MPDPEGPEFRRWWTRMLCALLLAPLKTGDCKQSPPQQHTCLPQLWREEGPDWREVLLGRDKQCNLLNGFQTV